MSTDSAPRRLGRPRDARADQAILTAVIDLLAEVGFTGLTIDVVAHRAGVGKATIYRRWDGKEQLVLEALSAGRLHTPEPDTGSLRGDLLAYYLPLAEADAQQAAVRLMPALAAEAAVNPELGERLRAFVSDRRSPVAVIFDRAKERGEIDPEVDTDLAIDQVGGPLMYRLYFSGGVVDDQIIHELIDRALRSIGAS